MSKGSAIIFYSFLTLMMLALTFNVLPSQTPLDNNLKPLIDISIRNLGLWQKWNMFSPNPTREDVTMFARVTMENGETKMWSPIRMAELSNSEKYLRERWRKWGMDNIRADSHQALWPSLGRYIERSFASNFPGQKVAKIEVYRRWYVIPILEEKFVPKNEITLEPRHQYLFYTYTPEHMR